MSLKVTLSTEDGSHILTNIIHNATEEQARVFFSKIRGFMDKDGNDHDEPLHVIDIVKI